MISDLNRSLGPLTFSLCFEWRDKFCTMSECIWKSWSLLWNELLTRRLPMFLSCLSEISGVCENIVPVSELFWSNLKFLRMIDLTAWLWGWNVKVNGIQIQIVCCYFGKHANNINLILPELVRVLVLVHNYIFCNCFLLRCCDRCDEWFHGDCIGITKLEAKEIKQYYCAQCLGESLS